MKLTRFWVACRLPGSQAAAHADVDGPVSDDYVHLSDNNGFGTNSAFIHKHDGEGTRFVKASLSVHRPCVLHARALCPSGTCTRCSRIHI